MRLSGKVALVTGAQQGIGRAIAVALARDGADVGVNYLDDSSAAGRVADEIRGLGRRAITVQADVSQAAGVDAMVRTVVDALGPPEVLVNNAGVFPRASFLDLEEREWDQVLDINLKGSFLCAQAVARALVAAAAAAGCEVTIGIRHLERVDLYWPHDGMHAATLAAQGRARGRAALAPPRRVPLRPSSSMIRPAWSPAGFLKTQPALRPAGWLLTRCICNSRISSPSFSGSPGVSATLTLATAEPSGIDEPR